MSVIDARGFHYQELNRKIKDRIAEGEREITLSHVNGQRYIGDGLEEGVCLNINGTPGNDVAAFSDGVEINVYGNGQDGIGNTMNGGKIVIHGDAGDILGYSMRGGAIYVRGQAGYRVGIHMKGYQEKQPIIIIGGTAGDFLGEYMAGGRMILLGLDRQTDQPILGNHVAVGMHGGVIYIRDTIAEYKLGREAKLFPVNSEDRELLRHLLTDYCRQFDLDLEEIMKGEFTKLIPVSSRPYGNMYTD